MLAGNGNNFVVLNAVQTHSLESTLQTGTGTDSITVSAFQGSSALTIKSGDSTDHVVLNAVRLGTATLTVDVGPGSNDSLSVSNSSAAVANLLDTGGTNGTLTGAGNQFTRLVISPNFTTRRLQFA